MTVFYLDLLEKCLSDLKQATLGPTLRILKLEYLGWRFDVLLMPQGKKDCFTLDIFQPKLQVKGGQNQFTLGHQPTSSIQFPH